MNFRGIVFAAGGLALLVGGMSGCATAPKDGEKAAAVEVSPAAAKDAIEAAKAAIAKAVEIGALWRDTEKVLADAEKAYDGGEYEKALKLATKAREQAELAYNQARLEEAKVMLEKIAAMPNLTNDQQSRLLAGREAVKNKQGQRAYDIASALMAELQAASMVYTVEDGDSLWRISAKGEVYADPYRWPLIYKKNSDQIKDADLIYPGQAFNIDMNPSAESAAMAIQHAKSRGAWAVGPVEASDRAYLSQ